MAKAIKKTLLEGLSKAKRGGEEYLAVERAKELKMEYLNLDTVPLNEKDFRFLAAEESKSANIAIVRQEGDVMLVGVVDPDLPVAKELLERLKKTFRVNVVIVSPDSLKRVWRLYASIKKPGKELEKTFLIEAKQVNALKERVRERKTFESSLAAAPDVTPLLEILFMGAVQARSSDVHIEPEEEKTLVRLRIDGVLHDICTINQTLYQSTLTRIKVLAQLKLNVKDVPQDGRLTLRREGETPEDIAIRVSLIPSGFGETIVMRLLGVGVANIDLNELGLEASQKEILTSTLALPNGAIFITGPTGSGKTTTLYASLAFIKNPEVNIITIENPIEYRLEGVTQTQISTAKKYTFASALRAVMRQDPDVVMVGEIRDPETADIAINAALTGHLVLSTLHTNDAPGAIERLQNLNVRISLIPAAIKLVIAQRLVRKLCKTCKEQYAPTQEEKEAVSRLLSLIPPSAHVEVPKTFDAFWRAKGCDACFGTGYFGQFGIFEFFRLDDIIEKKVLAGVSTYELRKTAMENGMITILQHGILKTIRGETSFEEVERVAGDAKYLEEIYGEAMTSILGRSVTIRSDIEQQLANIPDIKDAEAILRSLKEEDLLAGILEVGLAKEASDINIEPNKDELLVTLRVNGTLHHLATLPRDYLVYISSLIKERSGLPVGEYQHIQEGRFSVDRRRNGATQKDDIRVSIIPGGYGEVIVLRVLPSGFAFGIETLGIHEVLLPLVLHALEMPQGMIITTGPTGSGKTTTLYSLLKKIDTSATRVMTIEDPVEYTIEGAVQTQVNAAAGFTFHEAFRAILRQAPNIIMVGEIRDPETADIAINAALTGHLVLSTLHSNDALSAIERLKGLNVKESVFLEALTIILAQRLVRKLCETCKEPEEIAPPKKEIIQKLLGGLSDTLRQGIDPAGIIFYKSKGCQACQGEGLRETVGIFEVVPLTSALRELFLAQTPREILENQLHKDGGILLREDAALKLAKGIISLKEVERALGEL